MGEISLTTVALIGVLIVLVVVVRRLGGPERSGGPNLAAAQAANAAALIAEWGSGVGPVPGSPGGISPGDRMPSVLLRQYTGPRARRDRIRAVDAEALAARGYTARTESYVNRNWSAGTWLLAFLLFLFVIGILIAAYMVATKPDDGVLTVTYERPLAAPVSVSVVSENPAAKLASAKAMLEQGVIDQSEYEEIRKRILSAF